VLTENEDIEYHMVSKEINIIAHINKILKTNIHTHAVIPMPNLLMD
jgi:hypothetical protein